MKRPHFGPAMVLSAGLGLAVPAVAQETAAMPTIEGNTARVLVKRGEAYLQVAEGLALQPSDSLVLLEGAAVELKCGDATIVSFSTTGIYAIPQCPARVAAAGQPPAPAAAGTTATTAPAAGTGGVSKALITTGVVVAAAGIAAAAGGGGGGGDGGNEPPVSP